MLLLLNEKNEFVEYKRTLIWLCRLEIDYGVHLGPFGPIVFHKN